jgi:hypothetical protein
MGKVSAPAEKVTVLNDQSGGKQMKAIRQFTSNFEAGKRTLKTLISNPFAIAHDTPHLLLSEDLIANPEIEALGVINETDNSLVGFVSRHAWAESIATSMVENNGVNRSLDALINDCPSLPESIDPLDVWDKDGIDQLNEEMWFSVVDANEKFLGLFSSKDLLKYLSKLLLDDINLAGRIQGRINKRSDAFELANYAVGAFSLPAKNVGGDLVFIKSLGKNAFIFSLFDVSGKGNSASLVTAILYGILNVIGAKISLLTLIKVINNVLYNTFRGELFATSIIGLMDPENNSVEIADIGHSHYYFANSLKQITSGSNNIPFGVDSNATFITETMIIPEGDSLILISDGIIEQEGEDAQLYEIRNICNIIQSSRDKPIGEVITKLANDYNKFAGLRSQHDDASLIVVRHRSSGSTKFTV